MNIENKYQLANLSKLVQERGIVEALNDVRNQMGVEHEFVSLFTLTGSVVKSFADLPQLCRVLVCSKNRKFVGLAGIKEFAAEVDLKEKDDDDGNRTPK